jgi:ketosteroid isomerase-like protein
MEGHSNAPANLFTCKTTIVKKSFLCIPLFFAVSLCVHGQSQRTNEQEKVNQTVIKFFDGLAALDTKTMDQYITKDFLLLEDGAVWNMDTLIVKIGPLKTVSFSRTNHLNFIQTEVKGNTAWVAYNNAADMTVNGNKRSVQWVESAVLIKEGNEWKIQMLHSTPVKPKAR